MPCEIIGHRGARGLFPENTVDGFRAAMALGVRRFELDVGVTKDGHVVVHHDLALNPDIARLGDRWPAGSLPLLKALTLEDLEDIDVGRICPGTPTATRFPHQVPVDGARIPTLAQVLAIDPGLSWNIELKLQPDRPDWTRPAEEMVDRVLHVIDAAAAAPRVLLQSFDWRAPRHVARIRPDIARGWLTRAETIADPALWWDHPAPDPIVAPDPISAPDLIAAIVEHGGGMWAPYWEELTETALADAHAHGLTVVPWTVNEPADMRRLHDWGVDGLTTDYPDRAAATISR